MATLASVIDTEDTGEWVPVDLWENGVSKGSGESLAGMAGRKLKEPASAPWLMASTSRPICAAVLKKT